MPYYETVFIIRQDISATQVETIADSMAEIITGDGGKLARREYWGLKSMAYRMKKNKKGHYILFNYDAQIDAVREMERLMGLHEDILRVLTLRTDDLPEEPSVVMANRNERGGRYSRERSDKPRGEAGGGERTSKPRGEDGGGERSNKPGSEDGGGERSNKPGGEDGGGERSNKPGGEDGGGEKPAAPATEPKTVAAEGETA